MSDRQELAPWGLFKGQSGGCGSLHIKRRGSEQWKDFHEDSGKVSASKFSNAKVYEDDQVVVVAPGGGGYGDARKRDPEAIRRDLTAGWVTESGAAAYR
jgi:N-methylhydantoinase B/oxoprolinase/acetone carboxylase alpha subunit